MKKVVVLGGGSGLSALLRGIKYIEDIDITAIVTVADSGGSTGLLREHFNIPAVGDLRRVIASLSRDREHLEESMEYRINGTNTDLDGHTVGNLILTSQILMKQDFSEGIAAASNMLNIQGTVLPVSNEPATLMAEMEDGSIVEGEDTIGHTKKRIKRVFYKNGVATDAAIKSIEEADYIIFGIGSLYTSLIANLIYERVKQALKKTKAKVIYFANVFTQHGETDGFTLKDHVQAIEDHTHKGVIDKVIVSSTKIPQVIIDSYRSDNQEVVKIDMDDIIKKDLIHIHDDIEIAKDDTKHDEDKVKKAVEEILAL